METLAMALVYSLARERSIFTQEKASGLAKPGPFAIREIGRNAV